jgi:RND family efflux transporter MFP subunit
MISLMIGSALIIFFSLDCPQGRAKILPPLFLLFKHWLAARWKSSFLLWALLFGPVLLGCSPEKPYEKPPTPVGVQSVQGYTDEDGLRFSGSIKPKTQVELAFRSGGYVQEILQVQDRDGHHRPVQEGDWITQGTVLAKIRQEDYLTRGNQLRSQLAEAEAAREQAKAQLAEASAGLKQAQLDFERAEFLFNQKSLIKPEYDAAKNRLEAGQARILAAQAQVNGAQAKGQGAQAALEEGELTLKDTSLRAPLDGFLIKKNIEVGALVQPGVPAFIFSDISSVRVTFGVSDLTVPKLQAVSSLTVTVEAIPNIEFQGRISKVSPAADLSSRLFEAEIVIPNPRNQLKAGMIASVLGLSSKSTRAMNVVPLSAIVRPKGSPTGFAVFVCQETGGRAQARLRSIKLGKSLGNQIEVIEGLRPGEKVIVTGAQMIVDGQVVRVVP